MIPDSRFTYNITFVADPSEERELTKYLKNYLIPDICNSSFIRNFELKKVIETGGVTPDPDHGISIAFSAEFDDKTSAEKWWDFCFSPAINGFQRKFRQKALYFATLLQHLDPTPENG